MAEQKQEDPGKALKEKSLQEFAERTKGKPTPTQDELDRANLGEHILEHEADGGDPDDNAVAAKKHAEAKPGGAAYQTRQAQPRPKQPGE
jgi:hypothetical protein